MKLRSLAIALLSIFVTNSATAEWVRAEWTVCTADTMENTTCTLHYGPWTWIPEETPPANDGGGGGSPAPGPSPGPESDGGGGGSVLTCSPPLTLDYATQTCVPLPPDEICKEMTEKVNKAESTPDSTPTDKRVTDSISKDVKVLAIGEYHSDSASTRHYPELIRALAKDGFDCIFFEADRDKTWFSGVKPGEEGLRQGLIDIMMSGQPMDIVLKSINWLLAAQQAKESGLKVFEFDSLESELSGKDDAVSELADMKFRNQDMSGYTRIKLVQECKRAILVNGAEHVMDESKDERLLSIPGLLEKAGIKTHKLILRSRDAESREPMIASKDCPWLTLMKDPAAFLFQDGKEPILKKSTDSFQPLLGEMKPFTLGPNTGLLVY